MLTRSLQTSDETGGRKEKRISAAKAAFVVRKLWHPSTPLRTGLKRCL